MLIFRTQTIRHLFIMVRDGVFLYRGCLCVHVEASCLFVDLCLSPMLPLLNSEGSQFGCVSMVTCEIVLY